MRELYRKYFFVPKQGKVNEKNMMRRIALSVAFMVICMGAMSMSAYAFVTWNVTSGVNVIKSAHFDLNVHSLSKASADENGIYALTEGEHSFTLGHGGDATTGYYKILIDDDRDSLLAYDPDEDRDVKWTYYSKQIKEEGGDQTITIIVPDGKTAYVEFIAEWGTYSGDDAVTEITLQEDEFDTVKVESQESDSGLNSDSSSQSIESNKPADAGNQTQQTDENKPVETEKTDEQDSQVEATEPTDPSEPTDTNDNGEEAAQENDPEITPTV